MKQLKKAFDLVVCCAVLLGMMTAGAGAVTYIDADAIVHRKAVNTVTDLNVMSGTGDGTRFDPNGTISRGELCRIICIMLNGGKSPPFGPIAAYTFRDTADCEYALYIEYCRYLGIVSGRGDGNFDPDGAVTLTEASKMLLIAIGFDANVEGFTGWSWAMAVSIRANEKNFYTALNGLDPVRSISRDAAAQLIYNALHARMVRYEFMLTSVNGELESIPLMKEYKDGGTLLSRKFTGTE